MKHSNGPRKPRHRFHFRPRVEMLEDRVNPSVTGVGGVVVRPEVVALHEIGHSLGLTHVTGVLSIMNPVYNGAFDLDFFARGDDPAVAMVQAIFSPENAAENNTPFPDSTPGDYVVNVTWSVSDNMMTALTARFGSTEWMTSLGTALHLWAAASGGTLAFEAVPYEEGGGGSLKFDGGDIDGKGGVVGYASVGGPVFFDLSDWGGLFAELGTMTNDFDGDGEHGDGEGGHGGDLGGAIEAFHLPRSWKPLVAFQTEVVPVVAQRDLVAMAEMARLLQGPSVPVFLPVLASFQIRNEVPSAPVQSFAVPALNRIGWGQTSQADLYKVVFLPVLSSDSADEAGESPTPDASRQPEASSPVTNDPGLQTQTLQVSPAREVREDEETRSRYSFDSGTQLAGVALILGGYWAVPQEERERKKRARR